MNYLDRLPPQNIEAEEALLSACLHGYNPDEVFDILRPDDFYRTAYQVLFRHIANLKNKKQTIDLVTVSEALRRADELEKVGGISSIVQIMESPVAVCTEHYARIIKTASTARNLMQIAFKIADTAYEITIDNISEVLDASQQRILSVEAPNQACEAVHIKDIILESIDHCEQASTMNGVTGLTTGLRELDFILGGLQPSDLIILAARPAMGKAQRLTSKVLLENGLWKNMGSIKKGDLLASVDGGKSEVIGVFPQGIRPIYTMTLSDGRIIDSDMDHIWCVESCRWAGIKQIRTWDLMRLIEKSRYTGRVKLVNHTGYFGYIDDIGVDPWLIGFLLGDGCLTRNGLCFSNHEEYILDRIKNITGMELRSSCGSVTDWRIFNARGKKHPIKEAIKKLGMFGLKSFEKFIPDIVFESSKNVREMVLAGLLESDGWIEKFGCVRISTASSILADGVVALVRSLGGTAYRTLKENVKYTYKQEKLNGKNAHIISIRIDSLGKFIRSPRLLKNLKIKNKSSVSVLYFLDRFFFLIEVALTTGSVIICLSLFKKVIVFLCSSKVFFICLIN